MRADADNAWRWWTSLGVSRDEEIPPVRWLSAALAFIAIACIAALLLPWHHLMVPANVYSGPLVTVVVTGFDTDSWLIAVAVVALELTFRTWRTAPGNGARWVIFAGAFAMVGGMAIDYIDWSLRGVTLTVRPYYGPGFYVGLAATVAALIAAALAARVPV